MSRGQGDKPDGTDQWWSFEDNHQEGERGQHQSDEGDRDDDDDDDAGRVLKVTSMILDIFSCKIFDIVFYQMRMMIS